MKRLAGAFLALFIFVAMMGCDPHRPESNTPRETALFMLVFVYHEQSQYSCLDTLWTMESGWNPFATNPYSGAYGIPQSLPASKMASVGADYLTNPWTQIKWGLDYINERYGGPCAALSHEYAFNWY